ncbi:S-adenosylmethionine synthetase (5\'-end truncated) [Mycoplasma suis KI3806]|uniref:S-adenosylmethionine synthetase (5\'-end truncated) n=1 Tax=Mycoplasma suis (strain KI_3806) TaxID=708248 RepID=F0V2T9_MYCS3
MTQDQGIVFGFASSETPDYLPLEYYLAKKLILKTKELIQSGVFYWAKEDYKVLVDLEVNKNSSPHKVRLNSLVFSIQHLTNVTREQISEELKEKVIYPFLQELNISWDEKTFWFINSSGSFQIGGLIADTGVTNRKQIADNFGPIAHHGGGGLCGKDLTKMDRLGCYFARWVAKNLVAAGLATELELKITYAIAQEKALAYDITFSRDLKISHKDLLEILENCFPTKVSEIFQLFTSENISFLKLTEISNFGNFVPNLPWEQINKVEAINDWLRRT